MVALLSYPLPLLPLALTPLRPPMPCSADDLEIVRRQAVPGYHLTFLVRQAPGRQPRLWAWGAAQGSAALRALPAGPRVVGQQASTATNVAIHSL